MITQVMRTLTGRSWTPVAKVVLRQLRTNADTGVRNMTSSSTLMPSVTVGDAFGRPYSYVGVPSSAGRISVCSPHVRWVSGNSSALATDEEEQTPEVGGNRDAPQVVKTSEGLTKSNYWGIIPNSYFRDDGTKWPWHCFRPSETYSPDFSVDLSKHHVPQTLGEKFALWAVKRLRIPVDLFFRKRYGCRAMMLETVAAVPGMVGGMTLHLRSLRRFEHSGGWIKALLDEAENERMHLMTLMEVVKPAWYERALVVTVQGVFFNGFFLFYLLSPRLAHRFVGYLEEEAIYSYTHFLGQIDAGNVENVPAPQIAIDYWRLSKDATLRDVILALRADEAHHRDVNHYASDIRFEGKQLNESPAPVGYH